VIRLKVNGQTHELDVNPDKPLLWVIREDIGLTGTKFGCGMAQCGACTVHVDGEAIRSCVTPVSDVAGASVNTIEGLSGALGEALRAAWIAEDVPQCGYCQSGQIMAAAELIAAKPHPTDADIDSAMDDILCRCGTYQRIRKAIHLAARTKAGEAK
jgi:aerobic-type carbon monoxide dehydrogenase small subunit (CoxS/CutS family)